jgi:aspartokinase
MNSEKNASELKEFIEKNISPEKREEIIKLLLNLKNELREEQNMGFFLEIQKEINVISLFCTNMKKELEELKEQFKDLRDSFLMKVMMEKVGYVPLEKLPIYKNNKKE